MLQMGSQIEKHEAQTLGAVAGYIGHTNGFAFVVLDYADGKKKQLSMRQFHDALRSPRYLGPDADGVEPVLAVA